MQCLLADKKFHDSSSSGNIDNKLRRMLQILYV